MELSREQKDAIRAEEHFRAEVRRELERPRTPGTLERISAFFEGKVGFWLLTTVLAGTIATGFSTLQRYFERDRIERQEIAERARRDTDMLLRLAPMLGSEKPDQVRFALVLLNGLTRGEAVSPEIAGQVLALFDEVLRAGSAADASASQRSKAETLVALVEKPTLTIDTPVPTNAAQTVAVTTQTMPGTALAEIATRALPVRVYIQIADEALRPRAERARSAYREAGMLAPGIEKVPVTSAPAARTEVRYCADKVDEGQIEQVRAVTAAALGEAPHMLELAERLCTRVRNNHFELWFARPAG